MKLSSQITEGPHDGFVGNDTFMFVPLMVAIVVSCHRDRAAFLLITETLASGLFWSQTILHCGCEVIICSHWLVESLCVQMSKNLPFASLHCCSIPLEHAG